MDLQKYNYERKQNNNSRDLSERIVSTTREREERNLLLCVSSEHVGGDELSNTRMECSNGKSINHEISSGRCTCEAILFTH